MALTRAVGSIKQDKIFDTVALMVAAKSLKIGDVVQTAGYTTLNDGGGALYEIVAAATGTDDGHIFHDITAGNQARLIKTVSTKDDLDIYVDGALGSDAIGKGYSSGAGAFQTIQYALDSLPTVISHDVVINIADGTYSDVGGKDEFGRGACVDVSKKLIAVERDASSPLNDKKAKLIFRGASEAGTIVDGTNNSTTRYVFWVHETQGVQLENLTLRNSYGGVISHQNSDVTLRDVTTTGCDFGRMIESNSRLEVLRGTNGTAAAPNVRNYFIKNGQLQENDSVLGPATENSFLIDGFGWVYCLRVAIEATTSKNTIDSTGAVWMEFDDCNIWGGGNNFVIGSYTHLRFSNDTHIGDYTSGVFANEAGYADTDGLCHIYNNNFISFVTKGMPTFNLDNCDSKAATGTHDGANNASVLTDSGENWQTDQFVGLTISNTTDGSSGTVTANTDTTITATLSGGTDNDWDASDAYEIVAINTNGLRLQGSATSALIDPDCTITSGDKLLSRPTSGLLFKGTSPPSDVNTFYERGTLTLNEAASDFSTPFWVNTTKGYGGSIDFEPYAVYGSTTYNPSSLADGDGVTTTVTCTGADLGDFTSTSFSLDLQGITVTSWVSSANTVSVRFQNESGGVLDLGSGTLRVKAGKF